MKKIFSYYYYIRSVSNLITDHCCVALLMKRLCRYKFIQRQFSDIFGLVFYLEQLSVIGNFSEIG